MSGSSAALEADAEDRSATAAASSPPRPPARAHRWRRLIWIAAGLLVVLVAARAAAPYAIRAYVNQTLDQSDDYDGAVGDIDLYLFRGAYTIHDVRIDKTAGSAPVPFFAAEEVHLALEWASLLHGRIVGSIELIRPELNFVDAPDEQGEAADQTGAGGPWLEMVGDLFPFKINTVRVRDGSAHFRAYGFERPIDVYLSKLNGTVQNLTNVEDKLAPLATEVEVRALAMDEAPFELDMSFDPFAYRPTFQLAVRLLGLDVTELNDLTRAYGAFDFERGRFDLVVEVDSRDGFLEGYVKPLFRELRVLSREDVKENTPIELFWEALVGGVEFLLRNQPRDQFGTLIPFTGEASSPDVDVLTIIGNVLRNAFVRAYLPRLETQGPAASDGITFGPAAPLDEPLP